jgi:hypothetical protein
MFKHIFAALFAVIFGHGRRHHGGHCGALIAAAAILTGSTAHACCTSQAAVTHVSTACTQAVRTTFVQPMQVVMQAVPVVMQQVMVVQPRFVAATPVCACATNQAIVQAPAIVQGPTLAPVENPPLNPPAPPPQLPQAAAAPQAMVEASTVELPAIKVHKGLLARIGEAFDARRAERSLKQEFVLVPAQQMIVQQQAVVMSTTTTEAVQVRSRPRVFGRCL